MPVFTTIRYAGLRYLDRTAALESGEVVAHGAAIDLRFTATTAEALELLRASEVDCAEVPLATIFEPDFDTEYVALPVFPNRVYQTADECPILSVVVLRRSVYAAKRWLAVTLTDAFIEAKEEGTKRHEYFGALSVGLPWLMSALEDIAEHFDGDAYPYGLASNLAALERFASVHAPGADVTAPFAPEARPLPGVPDETFYAVPLSRVK